MVDTPEKPIVVQSNGIPEEVGTLIRYLATALGGWLVQRGWVSDSEVPMIVGAAMVIIPAAWGWLKTRSNNGKLKVLAEAAPNSVGLVK